MAKYKKDDSNMKEKREGRITILVYEDTKKAFYEKCRQMERKPCDVLRECLYNYVYRQK